MYHGALWCDPYSKQKYLSRKYQVYWCTTERSPWSIPPPFPLSSFVDDPPVRSQSISVIWWLSCTKCYPTTSTASQFGPFILLSLLVSIICLIFSLDIWFHILLVAKSPSMGKAFCDTICFFLHRKVRCCYENFFIIHKSLQGSP